jgi:hypothetical protein
VRTVCHQSLTVPNLYFPVPPQSVEDAPRTEHVAVAAGVRFEGYLDEWADGSILGGCHEQPCDCEFGGSRHGRILRRFGRFMTVCVVRNPCRSSTRGNLDTNAPSL